MNYVLKGRIEQPIPGSPTLGLDETLTIRGLAADAKAAGDAIREKANAADVAKEIERIEGLIGGTPDSPGDDTLAKEALETAKAAKTIAESTQEYVDGLIFVKTVNGIAPDQYGNVTLPSADEVSY